MEVEQCTSPEASPGWFFHFDVHAMDKEVYFDFGSVFLGWGPRRMVRLSSGG